MNENSCTCPGCLVPVADLVGTLTADEAAEQWPASEGVELRRSWNGRLALAPDDAADVFEPGHCCR